MPRWTAGRCPTASTQRLHIRIIRERHALPFVPWDPRVAGDVGDRVFAFRQEFARRKALVEDPVEARRLGRITLDRIGQGLRRKAAKMLRLAQHRPDPADLEHQPLERLRPLGAGRRTEKPGLFREINQDRARFEHREGAAARPILIDDRRDFAVGVDRLVIRRRIARHWRC